MRKSLLRRPSAALVLSSVALFMALGGGAYAAASSDSKQDKKIANSAAKVYFNHHIAGASVSHANFAKTAGSATNATNATNATTATTATTRDHSEFGTDREGDLRDERRQRLPHWGGGSRDRDLSRGDNGDRWRRADR